MSGKGQGNLSFFKVKELSENFANCQGNLDFWLMSGNCQGILKIPESSPVTE